MNPSEVLLVEDNAGDALLVGQALADCPTPVHLHIARDGEQALQILEQPDFKPDLIILDLNIPKISGYTVLSLYPPKKNKTHVVVFSASESEADVSRAFKLGAEDFVHKPMDLDEYKTAVSRMVLKWVPIEEDGAHTRSRSLIVCHLGSFIPPERVQFEKTQLIVIQSSGDSLAVAHLTTRFTINPEYDFTVLLWQAVQATHKAVQLRSTSPITCQQTQSRGNFAMRTAQHNAPYFTNARLRLSYWQWRRIRPFRHPTPYRRN